MAKQYEHNFTQSDVDGIKASYIKAWKAMVEGELHFAGRNVNFTAVKKDLRKYSLLWQVAGLPIGDLWRAADEAVETLTSK